MLCIGDCALEELDENIITLGKVAGAPIRCNEFKNYISPNVVSH